MNRDVRTEEQIRLVVESSPNAMVMVNRQGRIVLVNNQAEELFGYTRQELLGEPVEILVPKRIRSKHPLLRNDFFKNPSARPLGAGRDLYGVRKNGSEVPIEIGLVPIMTEEGVFALSAIVDISERKRVEENRYLRDLATHLQSVREDERTRISREIHDELGQALSGLKLDIAWLASKLPEEYAWLRERAEAVASSVDATIQTVRRISADLRPGILDDFGLVEAIRWQAGEFEKRTGIACSVELPSGNLADDRERATAVFRIFQESLTNVARHARATRVMARMMQKDGRIMLEVHDNGLGIRDEQVSDGKSLGLLGMRERARLFGGTLAIKGVEGQGTTVSLQMPLGHAYASKDPL